MAVKYNSKYIIPAPLASIEYEKYRQGDDRQMGGSYSITLNGSFLSYFSGIYSDSADNSNIGYDSDTALSLLIQKQNELRNLFVDEGRELEIQGIDETKSVKFYPVIESISFGEGNWAQRCEYTVSLRSENCISDTAYIPSGVAYGEYDEWRVKTAEDNYQMDNNDNGTATITRTISSEGALVYDPDNPGQVLYGRLPWQNASGWCYQQDDSDIEYWYSGIIETILPSWRVIDTQVNIDVDPQGGSYSIERGWIVSNTGVFVKIKSSNESEDRETDVKSLGLNVDVEGLGFTSPVRFGNAETYWTDDSITTRDEKVTKVKGEFSDINADTDAWFFQSFGETMNRDAGSISVNAEFTGHSGVFHSYNINASTEWIGLPEKTLSVDGEIIGTGDAISNKITSALNYYATINFSGITQDVVDAEFSSGALYIQNQSLALDHNTGIVSYNRSYSHHEQNYKDTWTVNYNQSIRAGQNDSVSVQGQLQGLSSEKSERWTQVFSAFNTAFSTDSQVWNTKVTPVLGSETPASGFVTERSFDYDSITGAIGYNYTWSTSPASGEVDYSIDASYDRATQLWTITLNGTARGAGTTTGERISNALAAMPTESTAWAHAYDTLVTKLDDNGVAADKPQITQLPNERYLTSNSINAEEREGIITFNYVWSSAEESYINNYTTEYSWDEASATETVTVNGTLKALASGDLDTAWESVYNTGDPDCPDSIYAARHNTYFSDKDNVTEALPTVSPISSTPRPTSVASFSRSATLSSSTYSKNTRTNEITYSFVFNYRAWPYSLPLWLTNVDIKFNKKNSLYLWARHNIPGKLSGPVHQDMNARDETTFSVSISLQTSKRKSDQFGQYLSILLEEYSEYILRKVFLERSGYSSFNYSHDDSARNCYFSQDNMDLDPVTGTFTRNITIVMINIAE